MALRLFQQPASRPAHSPASFALLDQLQAWLSHWRQARPYLESRLRAQRSGVASLFFFHGASSSLAIDQDARVRFPAAYSAWQTLQEGLPSLATAFAARAARQVARAIPDFLEAIECLSKLQPEWLTVQELLQLADDEVLLAIAPQDGVAVRLAVSGIADWNQLHPILAASLSTVIASPRPDSHILAACLAGPLNDGMTYAQPFSLHTSQALNDTTLAAADQFRHWLPGEAPLTAAPLEQGQRIVVLTRLEQPRVRPTGRLHSQAIGEYELLATYTGEELERWLTDRLPEITPASPAFARAA